MCSGIPLFSNNKKALIGRGTISHSIAAEKLHINEDDYRKYEYHYWDKKIEADHYDEVAESIVSKINPKTAMKLVKNKVKKDLGTQTKLVKWLKETPDEWKRLITNPKLKTLAKKVNPKLVIYQDKIAKLKKEKIEKYNPYQATKLPKIEELRKYKLDQVGHLRCLNLL